MVTYPLEKFRSLIYGNLDDNRIQHTLGVEVLARDLAKKHGLNQEAAALAALTHDMAKAYSLQDQIDKASQWKLVHDPEDLKSPQVLHGRIAAYILRYEYKIMDQDVLNAVAHHTLGRPGMSPLEMLIYSADLTEQGRDFPGVDKLREKLYDDLRQGTLACVSRTLHYLKDTHQVIHPLTRLTYESLINEK